jgi:hypothetical protein
MALSTKAKIGLLIALIVLVVSLIFILWYFVFRQVTVRVDAGSDGLINFAEVKFFRTVGDFYAEEKPNKTEVSGIWNDTMKMDYMYDNDDQTMWHSQGIGAGWVEWEFNANKVPDVIEFTLRNDPMVTLAMKQRIGKIFVNGEEKVDTANTILDTDTKKRYNI